MDAFYTQQNFDFAENTTENFTSTFHPTFCPFLTLTPLAIKIETEKVHGKSVERQSSFNYSPKSRCNETLENSHDQLLAPKME